MNESVRIFLHPDTAERYIVRLIPRELTGGGGVHPLLESLVFEAETGERVGTFPVYSPFGLQQKEEWELKVLLGLAKRRE